MRDERCSLLRYLSKYLARELVTRVRFSDSFVLSILKARHICIDTLLKKVPFEAEDLSPLVGFSTGT